MTEDRAQLNVDSNNDLFTALVDCKCLHVDLFRCEMYGMKCIFLLPFIGVSAAGAKAEVGPIQKVSDIYTSDQLLSCHVHP